jgi:hypothetical protein
MALSIGVTQASDVLTQSVEIENKMSEVVRKNKDGTFAQAQAFDPMISGSVTVLGTTADAVGGDLATVISALTGGVTIVTEKTHKTSQDNFDETTVSFSNAPGAAA